MAKGNEIGDFFELLSRAKWWILGIALISALVAGVLGYPGPQLYEANALVRVQFPASLARAPQPDRYAQMAKDPAAVEQAALEAGRSNNAAFTRMGVVSAVSPGDPRVVVVSVQATNARQAKRFLETLLRVVKAQAMTAIKDQIAGLKNSKALNTSIVTQVDKVVERGSKVGKLLSTGRGASAGERLLAEVGLLQMNVSALQGRASLQNANAQIDADLESLDNAVMLADPVSVKPISPMYRVLTYALRGLIVGLAIAIIAVFVPSIRKRLMS